MRQINPWMKAAANAERNMRNADLRKARYFKKKREAKEYLDLTHEFERTFSNKRTGEIKVMTGREAKELNDLLFKKYLEAMHKNRKGRSLERWVLLKK